VEVSDISAKDEKEPYIFCNRARDCPFNFQSSKTVGGSTYIFAKGTKEPYIIRKRARDCALNFQR